jgi:hypothetical protein
MPRSRYSAAFYLVLVFASGIMVGIVSHRLYVTSSVNANAVISVPPTMEDMRKKYLAEMRAKVGINDTQQAAVNQILDTTKHKFDELHRQEKPLRDKIQQEQVEAIRALLTEPQRGSYEQWREERARLQREEQQRRKLQKK